MLYDVYSKAFWETEKQETWKWAFKVFLPLIWHSLGVLEGMTLYVYMVLAECVRAFTAHISVGFLISALLAN